MRQDLRTAFVFYFSQAESSADAKDVSDRLRKIQSSARRLLAHPNSERWRKRLTDQLDEIVENRKLWVVHVALLRLVSGKDLASLRRTLWYAETGYSTENRKTLEAIVGMPLVLPNQKSSMDPPLRGLVYSIAPIYMKATGWSLWPKESNGEGRLRSPLTSWLEEILGKQGPTEDQVVKTLQEIARLPEFRKS